MNDCPRADIRDVLPDWVHGTLDTASEATVSAHVEQCADCAAEADLLRMARAALAKAPHIDTQRIAIAVKAASAQPRENRRRWPAVAGLFAVAAGIAVVMFGGASEGENGKLATVVDSGVYSAAPGTGNPTQLGSTDTANSVGELGAEKATSGGEQPQLVMGGGIADLGDEELEALLGALDGVDAIPNAIPEPLMTLPVGTSATEGLL